MSNNLLISTLEFIKQIRIDLTNGFITTDGWWTVDYKLEVTPKDFLGFSRNDFKSNDKRGSVNALTNAKRAIDCQTDKVFYSIGLDPNNFDGLVVENFIANSNYPPKRDLPIRLRLLQALGFAPAKIISEVRNLRHDIEHYYKVPSNEKILDAIELADLFIQATDNKLKTICTFYFSDTKRLEQYGEGSLQECIYITYNQEEKKFLITARIEKNNKPEILIENSKEEYYYLLKIATSFDYEEDVQEALRDWIKFIGHPIPREKINFVVL